MYEGLLPLAWGAFFLFLANTERVEKRSSPETVVKVQWLLGLTVMVTGLLKLLNRLGVIG